MSGLRALIAYEESYRAYGDVLENAVQTLRPHVEVASCRVSELDAAVQGFDPTW